MTFRIQLTTRDSQHLSFDCAPDQDLLTAAAEADITLPSQCRQGSCGACHASVSSGDYTVGRHNPDALPAHSPNGILMCRTTPCSDLGIDLPYDHAKILFHPVPRRVAEIVALEPLAENTVRLELRLEADADNGNAAEFEPGQFMELEVPGSEARRAYSLANTSNWEGKLEFLIRLQPNGVFSTFLRERATPGGRLMVRGAMGGFGIQEGSLRPRWFVAGGTGVSPMLSMLRRMAEYQELQEARLFFGVNRESELFALDDIEQIKRELPQLEVELCVWRPEATWNGFTGTPADALRHALAEAPVQPDLYVCGPPMLIRACEDAATEAGLPSEQFVSERFLPPGQTET
ncbi:2Fe-2S iron-sulfur cluster binding domain-containing protein [Trinickia violacea]|uniref:2Fe-2S iron-sulfur cluster binding domain-containing protein n=1 Tax=Trinickia violacea TaxID=2571746 RepID=A0A4P8ISD4_9BURK|nr:2Fe-2S iron-sulfur cluster binding domain-containing protein [Trinickia violacea]QCP49904.1 2Fe-2S iron-sulfur cluster binding domain-containing protein [Trinickia violacea]